MKNSITLQLFILCVFLSSCSDESASNKLQIDGQTTSQQNISEDKIENIVAKQKPWNGSAAGYVHTRQAENDRIELFIVLGKLLGAGYVYHHRAGELRSLRYPDVATLATGHADIAELFSPQLLDLYKRVDPIVQNSATENNQPVDIESTLIALTDHQQISDIMNGDQAVRDIQYAANQKLHLMTSRVGDAVLLLFPSRHEYLLASSALIREAGDKMAIGVAANGVVVNTKLVEEAWALMYQSSKLNPNNVTFCDSQRLALKTLKEGIADLTNKMTPNRLGQKLTVTATDAYTLANQTQQAGESLPIEDSNKCE